MVWLSKEPNCLATQGFLYLQVFSNFYQEFFLLFISFIQFFLSWSTNCPSLAHFLLLNMELLSFLDKNKMGILIPCLLYMHMLEYIHLPPIDKNESQTICALLPTGQKFPTKTEFWPFGQNCQNFVIFFGLGPIFTLK
jgi:hypothetical protein